MPDLSLIPKALPESWCCIDCGVNTAPGVLNRTEFEQAFRARALTSQKLIEVHFSDWSEVYMVRDAVWAAAGILPFGGCLCIGCLERRLGRRLTPKDFMWKHAFASLPGSARLLDRQGR
jgi:hypothetical protein